MLMLRCEQPDRRQLLAGRHSQHGNLPMHRWLLRQRTDLHPMCDMQRAGHAIEPLRAWQRDRYCRVHMQRRLLWDRQDLLSVLLRRP